MKRIIAVILCFALLPAYVSAAFPDVPAGSSAEDAISRLAAYGVLCGDENGNFNPDADITRAQFAKIATVINNITPSGASGGLFSDLDGNYWANGYITAAAKNKLILGYPDSTFRPESNITLAEAVTITLRMLGYTTEDLGNVYPGAYIAKANELGLCDGLSLAPEDIINRAQASIILDRALLCDINSTTGVKHKLITNMDYSVSDECIILATPKDSSDLLSDEISTSLGTYKTKTDDTSDLTGKTAKLVTDTDNRIVGIVEIPRKHLHIAVESVAGNDVSYRENDISKVYSFSASSLVYYNSKKTSYSEVRGLLETGMTFDIFYTDGGAYDYAILTKHELLGPKVIYSDADKYAFGTPARVVRDGYSSSMDKLEKYDVLYFDSASSTIYAYCDRVSGVYEKALPSKANISSITLSGKTYELETQAAITALGEYDGAYAINDNITCLLGKDGCIAAVLPSSDTETSVLYGVLLSCTSRVIDGTKRYYVTCLSSNGQMQEFETASDESTRKGQIMQYRFENGILKPSYTGNTNAGISGSIIAEYDAIGSHRLASGTKVIDVGYRPKSGDSYDAAANVIELSDIKKLSLSESDILFAAQSNGKITALFLDDVTKSAYSFGLVTSASDLNSTGTYTIDIDGSASTYSANFVVAGIGKGTPVMAMIRNSRLVSMQKLISIASGSGVSYLDNNSVTISNSTYPIAKNASFYVSDDNGHIKTAIDDIDGKDITSITLYSDARLSAGGQVRVAIVKKK